MKINLLLFVSSAKTEQHYTSEVLLKTYESQTRPVKGDILDDPGFHPDFHNGYEVVKVILNYALDECWVSLAPLAIELEHMPINDYIGNLERYGWRKVSNEELKTEF